MKLKDIIKENLKPSGFMSSPLSLEKYNELKNLAKDKNCDLDDFISEFEELHTTTVSCWGEIPDLDSILAEIRKLTALGAIWRATDGPTIKTSTTAITKTFKEPGWEELVRDTYRSDGTVGALFWKRP